MSEPLLTILKYCLLALLWLFFLRVLRTVWAEVRRPGTVEPVTAGPASAPVASPSAGGAGASWPEPGRADGVSRAGPGRAGPGRSEPSRSEPSRSEPSRSEPRRMAPLQLIVVDPPDQRGRTFDLGDELTLGRAQGCGVALPQDSFTSHLHARLWRQDGKVWVEDLGSTNGTYLNHRKLTRAASLASGDRLQVGRTVLEAGR